MVLKILSLRGPESGVSFRATASPASNNKCQSSNNRRLGYHTLYESSLSFSEIDWALMPGISCGSLARYSEGAVFATCTRKGRHAWTGGMEEGNKARIPRRKRRRCTVASYNVCFFYHRTLRSCCGDTYFFLRAGALTR